MMEIIVDEWNFPEWLKYQASDAEISSYGSWKLDLDSNLNWELNKSTV